MLASLEMSNETFAVIFQPRVIMINFGFYADPDYHRAWLRHGSKRHVDLKVLISYLPTADFPLIEPKFIKKQSRGKRKSQSPQIIDEADNDLRLAATIIDECETEGQREEYISALQKHASVHIYGRCGAPCPGWVTEDCLRYLDKHYKVHLYQAQWLKFLEKSHFSTWRAKRATFI